MRQVSTACVLAIGVFLGVGQMARAQFQFGRPGIGGPAGPGSYSTFSPYLNLLRGDQSTLLNYWGLVQPQMSFQQQIGGLQQEFIGGQASDQQMLRMALQSSGGFTAMPPVSFRPAFRRSDITS